MQDSNNNDNINHRSAHQQQHDRNQQEQQQQQQQQQQLNSMQSLASSVNSNNSSNDGLVKPGGLPIPPFDAANTMNFFQQQAAGSSRSSDTDIGAMDDVQFSASLDALLNGDQLSNLTAAAPGLNTSVVQGLAAGGLQNLPSLPVGNPNISMARPTQQQQQQQLPTLQQSAIGNTQQYFVMAPGAAPVPQITLTTGQPQHQSAQQQQQQQAFTTAAVSQLAGLPLAYANQAALQLVPPGPHSAAQMSLSAGHAAATGAFHPGNATATAPPTTMPAGIPQQMAAAPFPWAIATNVAGQQPQQQQVNAPVSSATTSSTATVSTAATISRGGKRPRPAAVRDVRDISAVSEDEGDREKRRQDRNIREQQRSHRITEQIAQLRDVLSSANLQFKPDKYSTLTTVAEYITQLQDRSKVLDAEHKKLLDTITETNEIVNNQYVPAYTSGSDSPPSISNDLMAGDGSSSLDDESMVFVRGIDYKVAFKGCGIPLALSSIDGRFLDCNDTFLELTGYSRGELLPLEKPGGQNTVRFSPDQDESHKKNLSLFNLLSRDGMEQVFMAMSEMLKQPGSIGTSASKPTEASKLADFWSGPVKLCRQDDLPVKLNCTLVRTSRGRPKFFNCALTALDEEGDDQTTITSQSQSDGTKETNALINEQQQQVATGAPVAGHVTSAPHVAWASATAVSDAQATVPPMPDTAQAMLAPVTAPANDTAPMPAPPLPTAQGQENPPQEAQAVESAGEEGGT
ncbi:expressed unknown protein [Seminavis robusta]|uniref:BHLH domain-containing protein n=1 Tax=Seminavis robusta TaxID=568900 RepID=A0A9N8F2Q0_9STRA|nr:expressed unknown protein [Seminavis robusta]|eukprot:Sro2549_g330890.1 n/a (741) ;mRNA; r:3040-5347